MRNKSFIRFYDTLSEAVKADDVNAVSISYTGFIVLKPNDTFFQITDTPNGIEFATLESVKLVKCDNTEVADVSDKFYFNQITDVNGINQIEFEFGYVGTDYGTQPLHLKLTDINGNVFYTNAFLITNNQKSTLTFDYWADTDLYDIPYSVSDKKQRITLNGIFNHTPTTATTNKSYTQTTGNKTNYRNIVSYSDKYLIEFIDRFCLNRLHFLFAHPFVYINGERVTISNVKFDERKGTSNLLSGDFEANYTGENYTYIPQLYEYLQLVSLTPENGSTISLSSFNFKFYANFNKEVSVATDAVAKLYKDNVLLLSSPYGDNFSANGNEVEFNFSAIAVDPFEEGDYSIRLEANKIFSGYEMFGGFGVTDWVVVIAGAEFSSSDFNDEFLI